MKTNFRVTPQSRKEGSGAGRSLFPWKRRYPWLVMTAEQLCVRKAGGEQTLLEERGWMRFGIGPVWLADTTEAIYPGLAVHLETAWTGPTPWERNLLNRVYKMYYSGTSDRGRGHDPHTRPAVSREHWRNWPSRTVWEGKVMRVVEGGLVVRCWRAWLC